MSKAVKSAAAKVLLGVPDTALPNNVLRAVGNYCQSLQKTWDES